MHRDCFDGICYLIQVVFLRSKHICLDIIVHLLTIMLMFGWAEELLLLIYFSVGWKEKIFLSKWFYFVYIFAEVSSVYKMRGSRTRLSATVRRTTDQEAGVFRHHGELTRGSLKPPVHHCNMVPRGFRVHYNDRRNVLDSW